MHQEVKLLGSAVPVNELTEGLDLVVPLRQWGVVLLRDFEGHPVGEAGLAQLH